MIDELKKGKKKGVEKCACPLFAWKSEYSENGRKKGQAHFSGVINNIHIANAGNIM